MGIISFNFVQAQAAELLMFEHRGCIACKQFKAEVLPDYKLSEIGKNLPIRSIVQGDTEALEGLKIKSNAFYYSPTFILVQDGVEIARIRGYLGKDKFWVQINNLYASRIDQIKS